MALVVGSPRELSGLRRLYYYLLRYVNALIFVDYWLKSSKELTVIAVQIIGSNAQML